MGSWVVEIYTWSIIWNFFDFMWPKGPPTEKVLELNMSFHDPVFLFSKDQNNSGISPTTIEFKNLKDSEVHSCDCPGLRNHSSLIDFCSLWNLTGLNNL